MRNFSFRRLTERDLPLIRQWLASSHVRAWWPDVERQTTFMLDNLDTAAINMNIVNLINHPFAFIQDFDARAFGQMQFADLPPGARVIETFVGDPGFTGQGHAPAYIDARVRDLRLHYPMVAVAPDARDTYAISMFTKAGFRKRRLCPTGEGTLVEVMTKL
jgi:aminoglycoside 6'-N-acetyltransferase